MSAVTPGERFGLLTAQASFPLDEVALLIAAHAYPDLDIGAERRRLDTLAAGCPEPTLHGVVRQLFGRLGFRGNRADYYDPRNSMLNRVLDRRLGIPITLAVVTIEVGRRIGVPLYGVGMPGHFLVGDRVSESVYVDVFAGGVELDTAGCQQLYASLGGTRVFEPSFLDETPPVALVARILANLRAVYTATGDRLSLRWVLDLVCRLPDADAIDHADHAAVLAWSGRHVDAASSYAEAASLSEGEEAEEYDRRARALEARSN